MRHMRQTGYVSARTATTVAVVLAVACSTAVRAQQNRPLPPEPTATTVGQVAATQPTFRAAVTLVTTDVIVRDEDGLFLPDLGRDDFEIFEDGVPQEIASLVLVHGGRVYNQLQPPAPTRAGSPPKAHRSSTSMVPSPPASRCARPREMPERAW